jgi:hypothetical protein
VSRNSAFALLAIGALVACEHPTATAPEVTPPPPEFGFGNGAPTGAHYNLNWIGVPQGKTADMSGSNGHVIFVSLQGNTKIMLCESGVGTACAGVSGFQVLDANGTDGLASFALPNPDPNNTGTSLYSVYVRALGTPGGTAKNTTCGVATTLTGVDTVCSVVQLDLSAHSQKTFQNVTKQLLYVYAVINGTLQRVPLFDNQLQNYFWSYDNNGLKLAQFRFYPSGTTVCAPTDTGCLP